MYRFPVVVLALLCFVGWGGCNDSGDDDDDSTSSEETEEPTMSPTEVPTERPDEIPDGETKPGPCLNGGDYTVCDWYWQADHGEVYLRGTTHLTTISIDALCAWMGPASAPQTFFSCDFGLPYPLMYGQEYPIASLTPLGDWWPEVYTELSQLRVQFCTSRDGGLHCGEVSTLQDRKVPSRISRKLSHIR